MIILILSESLCRNYILAVTLVCGSFFWIVLKNLINITIVMCTIVVIVNDMNFDLVRTIGWNRIIIYCKLSKHV